MALQRGPLIYCAEWADNNGRAGNIVMPPDAVFTTEHKPNLLNGVVIIKSDVPVILIDAKGEDVHSVKQSFVAIPYYAWANRGKGEMQIWFPEKIKDIELISKN